MALFTIADLHLALDEPSKRMDAFGGRWSGYIEKIKEEWESTVSSEDTVVIGGDVSWGMSTDACLHDFQFINSLPGRKIILEGNHDYWWATVRKMDEFCAANSLMFSFLRNNAFVAGDKIICGSRGWYTDEKSIPSSNADSAKIIARECARLRASLEAGRSLGKTENTYAFMHFPPVFGSYICEELVSVLAEYEIRHCFVGHIHGKYDVPQSYSYRGVCFTRTSADYLRFKPLKI